MSRKNNVVYIRLTPGELHALTVISIAFKGNMSETIREALQSRWPGIIEFGPRQHHRTAPMFCAGAKPLKKKICG